MKLILQAGNFMKYNILSLLNIMKLEKMLRAGAIGLALAVSSVAAKAQIAVNTVQSGNTFNYQISNNYGGGSQNSLSSFTIPVYGYQAGTAEFTSSGAGWSLSSSSPATYSTTNDGSNLTFSSDSSGLNLQPGSSMTLSLQASGAGLALTSQTAGFGLESGGSYSGSISSPGFVSAVPEPSTYGVIFGSMALAAAAAMRRKQFNVSKSSIQTDGVR